MVIGEFLFSNDLDGSQSSSKRRWRKVGLHFLFRPYEAFRHRSPFTHGPIIADLIRLLYLGSILITLFFLGSMLYLGAPGAWIYTGKVMYGLYLLALDYRRECIDVFAGLSLATAIHTTADVIVSESKKMVD